MRPSSFSAFCPVLLVSYLAMPPAALAARTEGFTILVSPERPLVGEPLRAVAVSEDHVDATLLVTGPDGKIRGQTEARQGSQPFRWFVEVPTYLPGTYRACISETKVCAEVVVGAELRQRREAGVWPVTRQWSRANENLFSAWIEHLFDDPPDAEPTWRSLHEVTRQNSRNFLHNHLSQGEDDERGLRLEPDCADLPYFLRAYFAWKLGLPFGYSSCSRGSGGQPPACPTWHSMHESPTRTVGPRSIQLSFHRLADGVQSGNGRVPATSDRGDFYPTRLAADSLRPGTVYADPYGHTLLLVHRIAQTPSAAAVQFAVDAQPDGTVARKRYWRGNFLFALDATLGSAGFKHFRPIVREGGGLRPLRNHEIEMSTDYGDYSLEQYESDVEGFYDRVDATLSPNPLDPKQAFLATMDALEEQVRARLRSVANGTEYTARHPGIIAMPSGAAIFETTGAWEDFATPSRDLRLLIALDVVRAFPAKVEAQPQRFALAAGQTPKQARADLEGLLQIESKKRNLVYARSDRSPWTLTLAEILARAEALEMAYNPNDCVETRWAAPSASPEASTCRRHAPADQAARMTTYRPWFHQRRRPPR